MKVIEIPNKNTITPSEMKDGEIAVIRRWDACKAYIGLIVQRYGSKMIALNQPSGAGTFHHCPEVEQCQVEVLPKGTILEI